MPPPQEAGTAAGLPPRQRPRTQAEPAGQQWPLLRTCPFAQAVGGVGTRVAVASGAGGAIAPGGRVGAGPTDGGGGVSSTKSLRAHRSPSQVHPAGQACGVVDGWLRGWMIVGGGGGAFGLAQTSPFQAVPAVQQTPKLITMSWRQRQHAFSSGR